jgi:lipopolysaccharide exporter
MAKGAAWMVLFKLCERSIGLVSTLVLARLLTPSDFGVVAMALSFLFLAEQLTAMGFDYALIQKQDATREHYDSAWSGQLLLGMVVTVIVLLAAHPIAMFYQKPELVWVVYALALHPILNSLGNIGVVAFRKELDFQKEFIFQLTRKALGFLIVVPVAFLLQSYWALVIGILSSQAMSVAISYLMHPYRPRWDLSRVRELFHFSRWLLINNLVGFFKERTADFFVGRTFGAGSLGTYSLAQEFANLPSTELSMPINRALMPGFAKLERHTDIVNAYRNALSMMAALAVPCVAGLATLAPFFVATVLGAKWLDVTPLIQVLAFNGALLMFHSPVCSLLIARNKPRLAMLGNAAYLGMLVVALALATTVWAHLGVRGAALATLLTSVLSTPAYLWILWRAMRIAPQAFMQALLRPALASAVMAGVLMHTLPVYDRGMSTGYSLTILLSGIGLGAVAYITTMALMWLAIGKPEGPESQILNKATSAWLRRGLVNK